MESEKEHLDPASERPIPGDAVELHVPPEAAHEEEKRDHRGKRRIGLKAQIRAALPFSAHAAGTEEYAQHDAELFYLKKQIHHQTPMVVVLEDGRQVHGVIEWYDKNSIKIRGKQRTLIYKSAIKYLYKHGETGANG